MNAPSQSSNGSKLIARVWHGATDAARADEYAEYLERTGARECRETLGNRGVFVLRRIKHDRAEFTFISLWDSLDAIKRFAGDDYEKAHYYPEDHDFLIELEPFVEHYDVLAGV
ncbi:MAG: antibiotic biosynthesis monooxygenase [Gemmatimonadales bacterium]